MAQTSSQATGRYPSTTLYAIYERETIDTSGDLWRPRLRSLIDFPHSGTPEIGMLYPLDHPLDLDNSSFVYIDWHPQNIGNYPNTARNTIQVPSAWLKQFVRLPADLTSQNKILPDEANSLYMNTQGSNPWQWRFGGGSEMGYNAVIFIAMGGDRAQPTHIAFPQSWSAAPWSRGGIRRIEEKS